MASSNYGSTITTDTLDGLHTPNTAPVLEFRCLYTQDLRRKQKRWQDGRLKFHTFNKKVMVYDERSNFVGEAHWREDRDFEEGEEFELERGGILVEVQDLVGQRDQDLTELVDKRIKERHERAAAKAASRTPIRPSAPHFQNGTPASHLRTKPLNAMLTPTGHYGRAFLPGTSPFEDRQLAMRLNRPADENERPAKRRRENLLATTKYGYAQNLTGAKLTLSSSMPPSTASVIHGPSRATETVKPATIDLTFDKDDEEDNSSSARNLSEKKISSPKIRPSKVQKTYKKSLPAKSGYASNLTGAALMLNQHISTSHGVGKLKTQEKIRSSLVANLLPNSSRSNDESEVELLPRKSATAKTAKKQLDLQKSSYTMVFESSSPPELEPQPKQRVHNTSKFPFQGNRESVHITKPLDTPANNYSSTPDKQDAPVSSLKIKSRPRKMMMMMQKPRSGVQNSDSHLRPVGRKEVSANQGHNKVSHNVILSQATIELDAFRKKQEDRLQARMSRKVPEPLEDSEEEDLLSAVNNQTHHQAVDLPFLRRDSDPLSCVSDIFGHEGAQSPLKLDNTDALNQRSPICTTQSASPVSTKVAFIPNSIISSTTSSQLELSHASAESFIELQLLEQPNSSRFDEAPVHISMHHTSSVDANVRESDAVQRPRGFVANSSTPEPPIHDEQASESYGQLPEMCADLVCDGLASSQNVIQPSAVGGGTNLPASVLPVSPTYHERASNFGSQSCNIWSSLSRPPEQLPSLVPEHFKAGLSEATVQGTSAIQPSADPPQQSNVNSLHQNTPLDSAPRHSPKEVQSNPQPKHVLNVKESPAPTPVNLEAPTIEPSTWDVMESLPSMGLADIPEASKLAPSVVQTVAPSANRAIVTDPPVRSRLLNPATRGKSLQALAASTTAVNELVLSSGNPMAPPPMPAIQMPRSLAVARIYPKPSGVSRKDSGGGLGNINAPMGGSETIWKKEPSGPWSREAWDLFGGWCPPATAAAIISAGKEGNAIS